MARIALMRDGLLGEKAMLLSGLSFSSAPQLERRTKPCPLDGCPMFASAYMGRKRWGAAPSTAPARRANGLRPRPRTLVHGVKHWKKSVLGPMYDEANMGHSSRTKTVVVRSALEAERHSNCCAAAGERCFIG